MGEGAGRRGRPRREAKGDTQAEERYHSMTVAQLREACSAAGLDAAGGRRASTFSGRVCVQCVRSGSVSSAHAPRRATRGRVLVLRR